MAIGMTPSNMAKMAVDSSMAAGQAQANSMGLGKASANALAVTNMIGGNSSSAGMGPTNKQEFGAAVVKGTLEKAVTPGSMGKKGKRGAGITPSMETQQTILNAGMAGKGNLISSKI